MNNKVLVKAEGKKLKAHSSRLKAHPLSAFTFYLLAMQDDVLVKVEGVSKKFCRSLPRFIGGLKRSLWYSVHDISSELFGSAKSSQLHKDEFWAVDSVSSPADRSFATEK